MNLMQVLVTLGGVLTIGWVIWFFLLAKGESARAQADTSGIQEVRVSVKGGYSPDILVVQRGKPVRIHFYRDETAECSERVIFSDFGINQFLPAYQTTMVDFTPDRQGEFDFHCGMNMLRGKLIVE
ncbi:cupredoxin domain-containing protein [candidate division KSB1 bacterium]|nr:cupredoxin domain-containing protein [candidate division KSB1 bacterium]